MAIGISYMGTKRQIASRVSALVADCRGGPFLDLFAGMCAVGSAVGTVRQVWSNDLQVFSTEVAKARFCSNELPLRAHDAAALCYPAFEANRQSISGAFERVLASEKKAATCRDSKSLERIFEETLAKQHLKGRRGATKRYDLLTRYFGGTYFGVAQSIDADSIRASIDRALSENTLSADQHRWLLVALCVALSRCSTTTGHFAQPLSPKPGNVAKFAAQRSRSMWQEWIFAIEELVPVGGRSWRQRNQVSRADALVLLEEMAATRNKPSVIYADPPYTKDQYSRYYHLYETVVLYDCPGTSGRGQYRSDRLSSDFSLASKVEGAISGLIEGCRDAGVDLILSYPKNGLLEDSRRQIPEIIRKYYRRSADCIEFKHTHSTLGASKGVQKNQVVEVLYRVKRHG